MDLSNTKTKSFHDVFTNTHDDIIYVEKLPAATIINPPTVLLTQMIAPKTVPMVNNIKEYLVCTKLGTFMGYRIGSFAEVIYLYLYLLILLIIFCIFFRN